MLELIGEIKAGLTAELQQNYSRTLAKHGRTPVPTLVHSGTPVPRTVPDRPSPDRPQFCLQ